MAVSLIIAALTCLLIIFSVLFLPKIRIGKIFLDTYCVIALIGAGLMLVSRQIEPSEVGQALIADTAINPIKILILFISMTVLSVYLDELGFFRYLANKTLKHAGTSQKKLFIYLYVIVSVLTVFTSNDVIILSFTPFICYFASNAKISPFPYLAAEFVAANTWSMALIIGNPTNIYLATAYGITFIEYLRVMILPTLAAGLTAFLLLYLVYRKKLSEKITGQATNTEIKDKVSLTLGLIHLGICTVCLAISSYIGLEMWIISLGAVVSLFICTGIVSLIRRRAPRELGSCLRRAPWQLIPFIISMFTIIIVLEDHGVTKLLTDALGTSLTSFKYGGASFLAANLINNIPMSVLFSSVINFAEPLCQTKAVYAAVVGSNIGAFFTPIGALAGIMWNTILVKNGLKFTYGDFLKMGVKIAIPTLAAALAVIEILL